MPIACTLNFLYVILPFETGVKYKKEQFNFFLIPNLAQATI